MTILLIIGSSLLSLFVYGWLAGLVFRLLVRFTNASKDNDNLVLACLLIWPVILVVVPVFCTYLWAFELGEG